ncbi:hypothetical protein GOBAR_DD33708 [Gossypium barbadense]|nr:hypothetical protein GOBAR_DD33708 [Gossypium barbadense]
MGVMLSILSDDEEHHADTINKTTCLVRASLNHFGAEDTTSITLKWTLSLLLSNRDKLSKVQQELDVHVAIEDCTVNGYHVSTGTWLIMNLHKIHHDPLI